MFNITSALVDNIKDAARLVAVSWGDTYHTEALLMRRWSAMTGPVLGGVAANGKVVDRAMTYSFKIRNRVGCDVSVFGVVSWGHGFAEDETGLKQKDRKVKQQLNSNTPPQESTAAAAANVGGTSAMSTKQLHTCTLMANIVILRGDT